MLGCVCGGGLFCLFLLFCFAVLDLSVVSPLSTHDNFLQCNDCHYRDDERSMSPKKIPVHWDILLEFRLKDFRYTNDIP